MEKRVTLSYVLVVLGLFAANWPLAVLGAVLLVCFGRWFGAVLCALLLDVAYGPAMGAVQLFLLPITFFVVVLVMLRAVIAPYVRPEAPRRI